jgi:CO/xanthine dehydrogenase FAD-binding subunit
MLKFKRYARPETLEEALKLNQGRANCVLGGTGWLKMGQRQWNTAIDLSGLGLDQIEETDTGFRIGAMVTLRQLECHPALNAYTDGAVRDCVKHIVGVQFRNCATVGGTFWGRYGFSDVLTCFMALDAQVELAQGGVMPLEEFAAKKADNDILTHILVEKSPLKVAYESFRNTETDFPVLAVAVSRTDSGLRCAVGARPARAELVRGDDPQALLAAVDTLSYGSNTRAGGEYRRHLAQVLASRCINQLEGSNHA